MRRRQRAELPSTVVDQLRKRIEEWRRSGRKGMAMPEPLWAEACAMAKQYSVYQVARALGIDYVTLKRRAETVPKKAQRKVPTTRFVELSPALVGPAASGPVVELSDTAGAKLTVRLPPGSAVEIGNLVGQIWSRRG
jgi:hypothetical protein